MDYLDIELSIWHYAAISTIVTGVVGYYYYDRLRRSMVREITSMCMVALNDKEIKQNAKTAIIELSDELSRDPHMRNNLIKLLRQISADEMMIKSTRALILKVLDDDELNEQVTEILKELIYEILSDKRLKDTSKDTLWTVVKGSITPAIFTKKKNIEE